MEGRYLSGALQFEHPVYVYFIYMYTQDSQI